ATLIREHGLERAASQRVRAGVEQGWASLAAAAGKVDPEPRHSGCERLAAFGEERRHLLGRRDVGIVFEVDERAREAARDIAPLLEAADPVTYGRLDCLCLRSQHGRGGSKNIYGRCGSFGIVCEPARLVPPLKRALLLRGADQPEGALLPLRFQLSMFADE